MLLMPVNGDFPVVRLGEWQSAHPVELKSSEPAAAELLNTTGDEQYRGRVKGAGFDQ
jgi:hypothetical protein